MYNGWLLSMHMMNGRARLIKHLQHLVTWQWTLAGTYDIHKLTTCKYEQQSMLQLYTVHVQISISWPHSLVSASLLTAFQQLKAIFRCHRTKHQQEGKI